MSAPSFASIVPSLRAQFPALARTHRDQQVIYLDGPAGSQVPLSVIEAVSNYYCYHNANRAGKFPTSRETDALMQDAHSAAAAWFGTDNASETIFGANMTTLTFQISRAIARTWNPGDRVVVTALDHDANVSPWKLAAEDRGVEVRTVRVNTTNATLDEEDFAQAINDRTRLVAFTCASNSVGSRTPVKRLVEIAHSAGAEVYLDAVHLAPHALLDVRDWDTDYCVCSAYKFFGPHVGLLWARAERLEALRAYKVQPAPIHAPGKWMTGTQNHAAICGVTAAIDYLCEIGRQVSSDANLSRRNALHSAFQAIEKYERNLVTRLIEGLGRIRGIRVFGITDPAQFQDRVPTVAIAIDNLASPQAAEALSERGVYCWHGHYYAIAICEALGQQDSGMIRLGLMHTNDEAEVDRTLKAIEDIASLTNRKTIA